MSKFERISVYGAGSWGTALASQVARVQNNVRLFLRDKAIVEEILNNNTNTKYLGDILLPKNIIPSNNLSDVIESDVIIIAVPSFIINDTVTFLQKANLSPNTVLLIATKGLASNPAQLISDSISSIVPNPLAFISGPNFASEVAKNLLTPATIASETVNICEKLKSSLESENFVISTTTDIITVQIAGAIKNIIAIKSGMYDALDYKENAKAGLITSGIKEIKLLSNALGGSIDTLFEPAVIGDLVLTCYSKISRNTRFGQELALHKNYEIFLKNYPHLVEGIESTKLIIELADKLNLNLPIISSVALALGIK